MENNTYNEINALRTTRNPSASELSSVFASGSLFTQKSMAGLPAGERSKTSTQEITTLDHVADPLTIFKAPSTNGGQSMKRMMEPLICMLLGSEGEMQITLSAFLSMANILGNPTVGQATEKLISGYGYSLTVVEMTGDNMLTHLKFMDSDFEERIRKVYQIEEWPARAIGAMYVPGGHGTPLPDPDEITDKAYLAYCAVIMACMLKQLNGNNFNNWLTNRFKAFCTQCGFRVPGMMKLNDVHAPSMEVCSSIQTMMAAQWEVRRIIFRKWISIASGQNIYSNVCNVLVGYGRGADMTHLLMINRFIVELNPHVLALKCMSSQVSALAQCYEGLKKTQLTPSEWAFARVLCPEKECAFMHRDKFPILAPVAVAIGQQYTPSLINYQGGAANTDYITNIVAYVLQFLEYSADQAKNGNKEARNATTTSAQQKEVLNVITRNLAPSNDVAKEELGMTVQEMIEKTTPPAKP